MSSLIYKQISQVSSALSHVSNVSVQSWTVSLSHLHHVWSPGGSPVIEYMLERHLAMYTSNNSSPKLMQGAEEDLKSFSSLIILLKKKKNIFLYI